MSRHNRFFLINTALVDIQEMPISSKYQIMIQSGVIQVLKNNDSRNKSLIPLINQLSLTILDYKNAQLLIICYQEQVISRVKVSTGWCKITYNTKTQ